MGALSEGMTDFNADDRRAEWLVAAAVKQRMAAQQEQLGALVYPFLARE